MDKEVELILSKLKIVSEEQERGLYLCDKENSKLLLDYIINLQQENERLKEIWEDTRTFIKDNKRLVMNKNGYDVYEDYKSRIEKAVEYIQNHQLVFELSSKKVISQWFDMFYKDILNILVGVMNK